MALRRNLLLAVLAALLAVVAYDHWPKPAPLDIKKFTALELRGEGSIEARMELWQRMAEIGPDAVEELWSHRDETVRESSVINLNVMPARAAVVSKWRARLLRMVGDDPSRVVHKRAVISLGAIVREDLDGGVPPELMGALRAMLRGDEHGRLAACTVISWLGERVASLRGELLTMDVTHGPQIEGLRRRACVALGSLGVSDEQVVSYLLNACSDEDSDTRCYAVKALDRLRAGSEAVLQQLAASLKDDGLGVRAVSLVALSNAASETEELGRYLRIVLQESETFGGPSVSWIACIARLAVRAETKAARSEAVQALSHMGEPASGWPIDFDIAVAGAIGRIAVAGRDTETLDLVLATLMEALDSVRGDSPDFSTSGAGQRLAFEALVELCLWREDPILEARVRSALDVIEAAEPSRVRKWCRKQLARLDG